MSEKFWWLLLPAMIAAAGGALADDDALIERGRYLTQVSGCNDCHTDGYMLSEGRTPEDQWLKGSEIGFRGGWGVTYPANLRLYMAELSEAEWIERAHGLVTRPPMPWFNVQRMADEDLRALYAYVRSLGDPGEAAPEALGPGEEPTTPYYLFEPQAPRS